jgi:hypothetical protein
MHFSGRESVLVEKIILDPTAPKFQMVLDIVAMAIVILAQTIVAVELMNFNDNYLCLLYAFKLVLAACAYWFMSIHNRSFGKKLYAIRGVYDVIQLGVGYVLFKYLNLHIECYIILCAVVAVELSVSTICVFAIAPKNKK